MDANHNVHHKDVITQWQWCEQHTLSQIPSHYSFQAPGLWLFMAHQHYLEDPASSPKRSLPTQANRQTAEKSEQSLFFKSDQKFNIFHDYKGFRWQR